MGGDDDVGFQAGEGAEEAALREFFDVGTEQDSSAGEFY